MRGDDARVDRINDEVRIAQRMDVALGTRQLRRHFEHADAFVTEDASGLARRELGVARAREQRRQPADFQFRAALDERIGPVELHDEAGLGVHEVRVFRGPRERGDLDLVAADFLRDSREVRRGDDNIKFGVRGQNDQRCEQCGE